MLRLVVFVCGLLAFVPFQVHAQKPVVRSPQQIEDSVAIARLAKTLTRGASTDSAKAARIYEWVAQNLSYDVRGYLSGRLGDGAPEDVFRKRVAVCGGYVALFERLAKETDMEVVPILGYAKGFTYRAGASTKKANHSWVAVRINGDWRLMDPTWGSGFVQNNRFEPKFTWDYFLMRPEEMILSHFPEESSWQFLKSPMRRKDFERLPQVPRTIVNAGFEAADIIAAALQNGLRSFPLVGTRRDVRIVNAPLTGTLARASKVSFEIVWPNATEVALVSGGQWRQLKRSGDRFVGEGVAIDKAVSLVGRSGESKAYETLLQYQVQ